MNRFSVQHIGLFLSATALLMGCVKELPVAEQTAKQIVVQADLIVGQPVSNVHVQSLRGLSDQELDYGQVSLKLSSADGEYILSPSNESGYYQGPESMLIAAETDYYLSLDFAEGSASAQTKTPPAMGLLNASRDYIEVDIQGDLVFLDWPGINSGSFKKYFYLITLAPTEANPEQIVRSTPAPEKTTVIAYNPELTLSADDFNYYGEHTVMVQAISKDYEHFYTAQSDTGINGPNNISNGFGYFHGSSLVEGIIEIR